MDGQLASEGGSVKMMANFLPFLQEVYVFVNRCYEVFRNAILQMYNFYLIRFVFFLSTVKVMRFFITVIAKYFFQFSKQIRLSSLALLLNF